MVIKLYISGISGNKEVKKKQQRVQMILDSKQINYEAIDITEPGKEKDKEFMQQNGKVRESLGKHPLPPQIFNDDDFCGDYEDFDMANEVDELEKFLHIETKDMENGSKQNEKSSSSRSFFGDNKDSTDSLYNPYEYHTLTIKKDGVNGLNEEIADINSLVGEKESTEEITKSEVNGESETVPTLQPSNENVETLDDAGDPEKEESTEKNETADAENEKEVNAEDEDKEHQVEAEMPEKGDGNEDVENPEEDKGESSEKSEEKEKEEEEEKEEEKEEEREEQKEEEREKEEEEEKKEKEEEEDVESKEKVESEEEEESDHESPESEKSQEE